MKHYSEIILAPLITEKGTLVGEQGNQFLFKVASGANKVEIKQAIESLLGAKVASVRTAISHGKVKRQGRYFGQRPDWKKAYVRLRDGENVPEFLEGS